MRVGHIHTDRSRERRVNSGKSDDSYHKVKTPSRDETAPSDDATDDVWKPSQSLNLESERPKELDEINKIKKKDEEKKMNKDHVSRRKRQSQLSGDLTKTTPALSYYPSPSLGDLRLTSKRYHSTHRIQKTTSNTMEKNKLELSSDQKTGDTSLTVVKRSISITLPNQLNHKLRKRVHTTNCTGDSKQADTEFRVRSSRPSNSRHAEGRGRKYSDLDQPSYSISKESGQKDLSQRKKHYSSFHHSELLNSDHQPDIRGLVYHYNEVERKNRSRRDKHKSHVELPGISDLARRHQDLQANKLLRIKQDAECQEAKERVERRRRRSAMTGAERRAGSISDISLVKTRDKRTRDKDSTRCLELEDSLAKLRIDSVHNSGHPDNYCVPTTAGPSPPRESAVTVNLSQSDSEANVMTKDIEEEIRIQRKPQNRSSGVRLVHRSKTDDHTHEDSRDNGNNRNKKDNKDNRNSRNNGDNRHQSTSRSHVIECRKVERDEASKHTRSSVQKIELVPRKNPERGPAFAPRYNTRQRYHTSEANLGAEESSSKSSPTSVKTVKPISTRPSKPSTAPKEPLRFKQTSRLSLGLEPNLNEGSDRSSVENHNFECNEIEILAYKDKILETKLDMTKPETNLDTKLETKLGTKQDKEADSANGNITDDEADTQNDKLVKILKRIDTQTLKRRLSLDKLDELDTDDESSLDRMLNQISAFVQSRFLRKRAKTDGGRNILRFGTSTVHLYDPTVALQPFTGSKRQAFTPPSILKKKQKTQAS